ncbi:MAG: signal peptidase II [Planctomycetota bacterium]
MGHLRLPGWKEHAVFWPVTALGIALDLWSKSFIFKWLSQQPDNRYPIIDGVFQFVMALNNGAAFGLAPGQRHLLIAVSFIALIAIVAVFLSSANQSKLMLTALGLFAAGVAGNLYDRLFNDGLVRDFIDVVYWRGKHWPAFNVADSMLCIAVGLLILSGLFTGRSAQKHARQHK